MADYWTHPSSHPDMHGDEPDPGDFEGRCPHCHAEPGEDCAPWCREDIDVQERETEPESIPESDEQENPF